MSSAATVLPLEANLLRRLLSENTQAIRTTI